MTDLLCALWHHHQVAETGQEIVGMIRGCIKTVTCGKKLSRTGKNTNNTPKPLPVYTKLAYILGLRVSPSHRYYSLHSIIQLYVKLKQYLKKADDDDCDV